MLAKLFSKNKDKEGGNGSAGGASQGGGSPSGGGGGGANNNANNGNGPMLIGVTVDTALNITNVCIPKYRVKGNFVEYVVECSRNSSTWQVFRRYQQFKQLDQQLRQLCSMSAPYHCEFGVVPVLTGSHWTNVTNQSPELVERRRRYLEIYLQQVTVSKNLFYAAKTPLYFFLHDGEVPVHYRSKVHRPLPGFATEADAGEVNDFFIPQDSDELEEECDAEENPNEGKLRPQIVAMSTQRLQDPDAVLSAAIPDFSPNSANRKPAAAAAAAAQQHGGDAAVSGNTRLLDGALPGPEKSDDLIMNDDRFMYKERCISCGVETIVDYDIEQWVAEGRCHQCKAFVKFVLVPPAELPEEERDVSPSLTQQQQQQQQGQDAQDMEDRMITAPSVYVDPNDFDSESDSDEDEELAGALECVTCGVEFSSENIPRRCCKCNKKLFCVKCLRTVAVPPSSSPPLSSSPAKGGGSGDRTPSRKQRYCVQCASTIERRATPPPSGAAATSASMPIALKPRNVAEGDVMSTTPSTSMMFTTSAAHRSPSSRNNANNNNPTLLRESLRVPTQGPIVGSAPNFSIANPRGSLIPSLPIYTYYDSPPHNVRYDVSLQDFVLVTTLGRGTFGKVMKVVFRGDGKVYAMKVLSKLVIHKRRMIDYIKEEKQIMTVLPVHPFICTLHFAFQTEQHVYFVMDYLPGGELYTHIYPNRHLNESDARYYIAEVILALEHLHRNDIVHRDIKPENIVLDANGHAKLTDFGLARMNFSKGRRRSFVGSAEYLSPETIQGEVQTKALDWWSVGVMLFEMLNGAAPFHAPTNNDVYQAVLHKKLEYNKPCFSPSAQNLLQKLLEKDPRQRLVDPGKIKAHPFFESIDWEALISGRLTPPFIPCLNGNDTKYFSRDFTSEWATIPRTGGGAGRQTLELLTRRFSNFHVIDENAPTTVAPPATNINDGNVSTSGGGSAMVKMPELINPTTFVGLWRLLRVELRADDGKVSFPWGSEVCGMLMYGANGLYSMQICPLKRHRFKSAVAEKMTATEMSEAFATYIASFGTYQVQPGTSYLVHIPNGALCPNFADGKVREKRFFELEEGRLTLLSAIHKTEEGVRARTAVVWERVVDTPEDNAATLTTLAS